MRPCRLIAGSVVTFLGFAILTASLFVHFWMPGFVKQTIKDAISVTGPTCPGYKAFRNASEVVDIYEAYYLFNVDNAKDFENGKTTELHVTQKGPYTFKLNKYRPEANISWRTDGTVFYMAQTEYEFVPSMSADFDEVLTTYRMALFGGIKKLTNANQTDFMTEFEIMMFNKCLCGEYKCESWLHPPVYSPFLNITAREFLFGFNDEMAECATKKLFNQLDPWTAVISQPINSTDSTALSGMYSGGKYSTTIPNPPPTGKENEYSMYLGMKELPYWNSTYANMLNGTGGTSLEPGTAAVGKKHYMFVTDFLRSITVIGVDEVKLHGVDLVRYTLDDSSLLSGSENPDNKALYITTRGVQPAPPSVVLPVYFSKPYYLDADHTDALLSNITFHGPAADLFVNQPDAYNVYLDFEPHTGALLQVNKRIQASVKFEPNAAFPSTRNWPTTYAPVFWVDEYFTMSKTKVDEIKTALFLPLALANYGGIIGAVFGAILLVLGLCCCRCGCTTRSDDDDAASASDDLYKPVAGRDEKTNLNDSFTGRRV